MQARERQVRLRLDPDRRKDLHPAARRFRADRVEQRRLPGPSLTADHKSTAGTAASLVDQITQGTEFALSPEQAVQQHITGRGIPLVSALPCLASPHWRLFHGLRRSLDEPPPPYQAGKTGPQAGRSPDARP